MNTLARLDNRSRRFKLALGAVLVVLIGFVDYVTGSEISFSIFYLLPISLMTWYIDRRTGLIVAAISAAIWLLADLSGSRVYSSSAIPYWNAAVRFGFFVIVTYGLASLRATERRQEELGYFIVHDLRSPLSNIVVALDYLLEAGKETLSDDDQKLIRLCITSSNRLMTLINTLLDLARLERGKMELKCTATPVDELFSLAAEQVSALAERKDVDVEMDIRDDATTVFADTELTVRVLVNLLSNALKYSPSQSMVILRAAADGDMIAISTIDAGPGIPETWAKKVFHKFTQIEASKAGVGVGSGLGLSFCRYAIEAQGGRIWVESGVGTGTRMIFTLPRPTTDHTRNGG